MPTHTFYFFICVQTSHRFIKFSFSIRLYASHCSLFTMSILTLTVHSVYFSVYLQLNKLTSNLYFVRYSLDRSRCLQIFFFPRYLRRYTHVLGLDTFPLFIMPTMRTRFITIPTFCRNIRFFILYT